jgi:hypothetical protein
VIAVVTIFFSRLFGRKMRTGLPDFSAGDGATEWLFGRVAGFAFELREDFRRARAGREVVCRAVGRGFFFISAEDSQRRWEGTIILRARRATFPDAGRPRNQSRYS